jgi:hypothetical protein
VPPLRKATNPYYGHTSSRKHRLGAASANRADERLIMRHQRNHGADAPASESKAQRGSFA